MPPSVPPPPSPEPATFHRRGGQPSPTTPDAPYHQLAERPPAAIYHLMGETHIRTMIREFYGKLHTSPIKAMFAGRGLEESVARNSAYFIWLLGGPPLFQEQYGPPRLRARHLPFIITESSRQIWLDTFLDVLDHPQGFTFPREHLDNFKQFLRTFSKWMVNHHGPPAP